jgi:hypothetical protein
MMGSTSCAFHHFNGFSQNFATNYKSWKHANSCCTYNQRQIVNIIHLIYICFIKIYDSTN